MWSASVSIHLRFLILKHLFSHLTCHIVFFCRFTSLTIHIFPSVLHSWLTHLFEKSIPPETLFLPQDWTDFWDRSNRIFWANRFLVLFVISLPGIACCRACALPMILTFTIFFNGRLGDQLSQNILEQSYHIFRIGTHMVGHDQSDLLFAIAQETLLW